MPALSNHDPWATDREARLRALSAGRRRIVYYYDPVWSAFRYRAINMAQAVSSLPTAGISASWFTQADLESSDAFIDRADALVICRSPYDASINRMVTRAKARGLPVLFDVDDLVFDTDYVHLILDALERDVSESETWNYWFATFGRIGATLRLCDGAIVTNSYLADRVTAFANWIKPTVIPNFLNRAQQSVSRRIFTNKRDAGFARNGQIHIGYFSGTATHNRDFGLVSSTLARLLKSDRRIHLRVVGPLELQGSILEYQDRIERYPLQYFLNLQRLIGEVEINLAPLLDTPFHNSKSELKFFEAAIVGTVTIASPTVSFRSAIQDGQNGFLANAHEWEAKIHSVIDAIERCSWYQMIAERGFQYVQQTYGWDRLASLIETAVFSPELSTTHDPTMTSSSMQCLTCPDSSDHG
jgi:glycosyltransferase involved in cell wall biosynthesis